MLPTHSISEYHFPMTCIPLPFERACRHKNTRNCHKKGAIRSEKAEMLSMQQGGMSCTSACTQMHDIYTYIYIYIYIWCACACQNKGNVGTLVMLVPPSNGGPQKIEPPTSTKILRIISSKEVCTYRTWLTVGGIWGISRSSVLWPWPLVSIAKRYIGRSGEQMHRCRGVEPRRATLTWWLGFEPARL